MSIQIGFEKFCSVKGNRLKISDQAGKSTSLLLKEVKKSNVENEGWESFSLFLEATDTQTLTQGTYHCSHESLGEFDLFVSPRSSSHYESIFTHALDDSINN